jgi:rubredoxin
MECRGHGASGGDWVRLDGFYPNPAAIKRHQMNDGANAKTWMCLICGFIYDEASGIPEEGIPPGTRWEDVPLNRVCPECGARKFDFEMVEF